MTTKGVSRRARSGREVIQAIRTHAKEVQASTKDVFAPVAKAKDAPDVGPTLLLAARLLEDRIAAMEASAVAHTAELADDKEPRDNRDAAEIVLRAAAVTVRGTVNQVYGPRGLAQWSLTKAVPDSTPDLLAYATTARAALKNASIPAPKYVSPGVTAKPAAIAEPLDAPIADLTKALADVSREAREAESTKKARDRNIAAYDLMFRKVANLATATFDFAGEQELAERVRPSLRKPGRTEADVAADDGEDDDAPA